MAIENSQAPRRKHQHGRAGEKNLHEADGEQALVALKARRNEIDEPGRGEDAGDGKQGGDEEEEREDGFGELGGFLVALLGAEARVDGDEGGRKHALAEEVLQEVGNTEGGAEGVGGIGVAEVVGEDAVADEADEAAEQDAGSDEKRMRFGGCAAGWVGQRMIIEIRDQGTGIREQGSGIRGGRERIGAGGMGATGRTGPTGSGCGELGRNS